MTMKKNYMVQNSGINIDEAFIDQAARLRGINEKTALVRIRFKALIFLESTKQHSTLKRESAKLGIAH